MQPLDLVIGGLIVVEAAANIVYWRNDHHPFLFQLGRALRLGLGAVLIILGLM